MSYRMGIDIGGTFTDFALIDDDTGHIAIHKQLTTPHDPSIAVLDGLGKLIARQGVPLGEVTSIIHGSTLVTNAVIERKGAVTGMLVTRGFRDTFDIGREQRYDLYDLAIRVPAPMIPRSLRVEVSERIRSDGEVIEPLDLDEVASAVGGLIERHGIEALAVCFLHSFTNPAHEAEASAFVERTFPGLHVSGSADVFPFARELERWTTTAINAFARPMADRYLSNLESGLAELGFVGTFYIMTSSGGSVTTDTARRYPVRMLESGPAAGVLMSAYQGRTMGLTNLLSFDMGGTTAKGSIVRGGAPRKVYELEIARVHEFKQGSGLSVKVPVIDMIEIGAGGGGIAAVDERGVIRVGPESAGADPGPACYGAGGTQATLTDANLMLGYLDPEFFLGGEMKLDRGAAEWAVADGVARTLGLDPVRAAWGIHEIINEDVARAFRVHASEIGFDYRNCSMIAFGGSGPAHALRIARKLRIPRVIFPAGSGVISAVGMLVCPVSFQIAKTNRIPHAELSAAAFAAAFRPIEEEAAGFLLRAGIGPDEITITRRVDMRYQGQGYEIEVDLPAADDVGSLFERIPELYAKGYAEVFSISYIEEPVEIVNWKVEVSGPWPETSDRFQLVGAEPAPNALKGRRPAYFPEPGDFVDCPVYDRYALAPRTVLTGPALIEERESTWVVGIGDEVTIGGHGNLVAEIGGNGSVQ